MAFNVQTFKTRALTAVIFVVVMLAGLLLHPWSFFILFSIVHFGAWVEYGKLVSGFNPSYSKISAPHRIAFMLAGWCMMLYFTNHALWLFKTDLSIVGLYAGIGFMILLPMVMFTESKLVFLQNVVYSFFGLLYISLPLGLLVNLRMLYLGEALGDPEAPVLALPLAVIFSVWINDTMAYIVGSFIGKTPFSKISPKKTWEGTIGGAILCVVVMGFLVGPQLGLKTRDALWIAGLAAVAGTYGDLFESKLKRMAGVKDSGSIMPGHGGFLDRFDSVLFASVAVWFYASFFMHY